MAQNAEEFFYLQNQIIELRNKVNQIEMDIIEIIDKKLGNETKPVNDSTQKQDTLNECILDIAKCYKSI
ncbi:MAG: hypothetical protein QY317_16550 [Candidatus Jettenia caeni]|nr:MAG: hypothetical protein QY317_16550 [Candidatus Jettenia caeni]